MSFDEYAAKSVTLMATAVRGAAYSRTVAATFDLAIVEAVAQAPAAEHLIAYLAHCAPERIPMMLVESALEDGADRSGALVALADISLVRNGPFEDGTPAISVHRLVQAAARGRIEKSALATLANQRLKTQLTRLFPTDGFSNPSSWTHCARLAPHCHQALNQTGMSPPKNADDAHLWNMMGRYFHGRADYKQAERCFRSALEIREELLGNTHQDTAKSLSDLAALLMERNQLIEARSLLERAVTIAEATVGRDHEFTAAILNNFARLLQTLNEFDRAEALLKRVIKIFEDIFGENDRHTATSVNNLALLYQARGEFNLAKTTHQRALAIREVVFGSDHPDTANSLNNIATLLRDTGDRIQSEQLYLKAIAIDEKILGLEHPVVGRIKANYARLLLNFERTNEARAIGESALAIHEKGNSVGHNWTKDSAQVTADALDALGLADEAIALRARLGLASSVD